MRIYISSFYNVRFFTPNIIPISTAASYGWPWWLVKADGHKQGDIYLNKDNVMIGIKEDSLAFPEASFETLTEQCQKDCPYKEKAPKCQFMNAYYKHLQTLDFSALLVELGRVANDVKKITKFETDPIIVLMVYESPSSPCGERPCLQKWFSDNGYELKEWSKDIC